MTQENAFDDGESEPRLSVFVNGVAKTPDEKEALLAKAEAALLWFRGVDQKTRQELPVGRFREHIAPVELMQVAVMLKDAGQDTTGRRLREMLFWLKPTPEECLELTERLSEEVLAVLKTDKELTTEGTDSLSVIDKGTKEFFEKSLTAAEKIILFELPETPLELMKAISKLSPEVRPSLIRYYLRQYLKTTPTPEECATIADSIGSGTLMSLALNRNLVPLSTDAVANILQNARQHWQDPAKIQNAVDALQKIAAERPDVASTPSYEERKARRQSDKAQRAALDVLWKGSTVSVEKLVDQLASIDNKKEADDMLAAIISLGREKAKGAFAENLQRNKGQLVAHLLRGLENTTNAEDDYLFYPVLFSTAVPEEIRENAEIQNIAKRCAARQGRPLPSAEQAAVRLLEIAQDYDTRKRALKTDENNDVQFWLWNDDEQKAAHVQMPLDAAYRAYAAKYARQAHQILPDDETIKRFYLITLFEYLVYQKGHNEPILPFDAAFEQEVNAANLTSDFLVAIADEAMATGHFAAAQSAVELYREELGADSAQALVTPNGKPSFLVKACESGDPRVRFAALKTIMALKPETAYPGASVVSETLVWFAAGEGKPTIVVAHPKTGESSKIVGHFNGLGYRGELASNCGDAMRLAAASPDVELVLVDEKCVSPPVADFVQEMRNDSRTRLLPIAVLTDDAKLLEQWSDPAKFGAYLGIMRNVDRTRYTNPYAFALARVYALPGSVEAAQRIDNDIREKLDVDPIPPETRLDQAKQALQWLQEITEKANGGAAIYRFENFDETVRVSLRSEQKLREAMRLAAVVKSAAMQNELFNVVSEIIYSEELRREAVKLFEQSVNAHGVLLRGQQVHRLYERYNAGEKESKETQEMLGAILDIIEKKSEDKKP